MLQPITKTQRRFDNVDGSFHIDLRSARRICSTKRHQQSGQVNNSIAADDCLCDGSRVSDVALAPFDVRYLPRAVASVAVFVGTQVK